MIHKTLDELEKRIRAAKTKQHYMTTFDTEDKQEEKEDELFFCEGCNTEFDSKEIFDSHSCEEVRADREQDRQASYD